MVDVKEIGKINQPPAEAGSFSNTENLNIPNIEQVENTNETAAEPTNEEQKTAEPTNENTLPRRKKAIPTTLPTQRDEISKRIEKIMEEGVGEAYSRLSPIAKQEFKLKGERTTSKIRELLEDHHIKIKKILKLILEWLKMLPGVNRFFIEQEAKIKTDKIIALHKLNNNKP